MKRETSDDLLAMQQRVQRFRYDRGWTETRNAKEIAISLLAEATELLDEFKWKSDADVDKHVVEGREAVVDEMMDVLYHILWLAHDLNVDIPSEFERKMQKNEKKYPVR